MVGMDWTAVPVHMIDFEGCTRSGIVEYGVVTLFGGEVAASQGRLCASTGPIWSEDTRVHGLRGEELSGLEPFSCEWERFAGLRETGVLAAHFAATERRLLRAVWPYPRTSPDFLNTVLMCLKAKSGHFARQSVERQQAVETYVDHAAAEAEELLPWIAIAAVLLHGILHRLFGEAVLQLEG